MPSVTKNRFVLSLIVSLAIATVLSVLYSSGFLYTYNIGVSDSLYGGKEPMPQMAIIGIDDKSLQEIGRWPWNRSVHAQLLDIIGSYAGVTAFDISFFEPSLDDAILQDAIDRARYVVLVSEYTSFSEKDGSLYGDEILEPVFTGRDQGFANIFTDSDGVVRSFPPHVNGVKFQDSFDVAVIEAAIGGFIEINSPRVLINYAGPPGTFDYYSYSDVLSGEVDPAVFEKRIVLVGATAPDLRDTHLTPVSSIEMPGVEIHANALQTILTEDFLDYQNQQSVIAIIFILCILTGLVLYRFRLLIATALVFAIALAYVLAIILVFDRGVILNIIYPFLAIFLTYIGNVGLFYATEKKQRKFVTNVFGKYVSKEVASEILKMDADTLHLKGEKRRITVLFSDIRGFTSISEKLTPEQLVEMLNKYLSAMTDVIMQQRGVVDKYIGDAIMAFWGAPLSEANHARLACEAALGMKKKLNEINIPNLSIGVGINTGEAIVGNMGSVQRLNYTAIGDVVNASSRMEGLNKEYGTMIIVGESTKENAGDDFIFRELDLIKVKGKDKPIRIFELVGRKGEADSKTADAIKHFSAGLELYRKAKWDAAIDEFSAAAKSGDKTSDIFVERCKALKKHPPEAWDGVYTAKTK